MRIGERLYSLERLEKNDAILSVCIQKWIFKIVFTWQLIVHLREEEEGDTFLGRTLREEKERSRTTE